MSVSLSCLTLTETPLKKNIDERCFKNDKNIERDLYGARKVAESFNRHAMKNNGKVGLSDRFETIPMGFELKTKNINDVSENMVSIYRKEKPAASPSSPAATFNGYGVHKPLTTARGFYRSSPSKSDSNFTPRSGFSSPTFSPGFGGNKSKFFPNLRTPNKQNEGYYRNSVDPDDVWVEE